MSDEERVDPVDIANEQRRRRFWATFSLGVLVVVAIVYWQFIAQVAVDYESDVDHFKYGSIGSDSAYSGIPLRVWQVLPAMFPEYLPDQGAGYLRIPATERTYLDGYAQCGFLVEERRPLPIGFSQRRVYTELVGLNCALCHTGTVKLTNDMDPARIYGGDPTYIVRRQPQSHEKTLRSVLIPGMPANTLDLEAYFVFLFRCAEDQRFTPDNILGAVDVHSQRSGEKVGPVERIILRRAIPTLRETLLTRRRQLHYLSLLPHAPTDKAVVPSFGPGRIDTFSPYKSIQFSSPYDGTYGIADYPSIWNQRPREGMNLHWDGNNTSVFERNISASLGAGVTPVTIDFRRMLRVAAWIGSPAAPNQDYGGSENRVDQKMLDAYRDDPQPLDGELRIPQYPFAVVATMSSKGEKLFDTYCARCHDWKGERIGQVEDIANIQTDSARLDSYTEALQANQNLLGAGNWWRFHNFRKTHGYANSPLDGIWVRAPYLHNGSVPTLYDLLNKPCDATDLTTLGISAKTDLQALAADPKGVAAIIAKARELGRRPPVFYRGDDEYDPVRGGFRCDRAVSDDVRKLFFYSTVTVKDGQLQVLFGNGHQGHYGPEFGTELSPEQKAALVEYQKTIGERES